MPHSTVSSPMTVATPASSQGTLRGDRGANGVAINDEAASVDLLLVARSQIPRSSSPAATMEAYRAFRDKIRQPVLSTYNILGFLSSGTYGRVYKASLKNRPAQSTRQVSGHVSNLQNPSLSALAAEDERSGMVYAIKKFKPDKEDHATYTGISQSAMREISLVRELHHENIVSLREVILEDKAIYMVFHYASHDLLQMIHHHSSVLRQPISLPVLKSVLFQLLNGVHYLHSQFVLHRDLKPANILLTCNGIIKIADLGLARVYQAPLQSLYAGDKVVVTIWYRAPELLLGTRHYNAKIDMWAIGCIWGELLALRPMFKGEEAKMDPKTKQTPFQNDQITRIVEVMGTPSKDRWPGIEHMPDYKHLWPLLRANSYSNTLHAWYEQRASSSSGFDLFDALLQFDPNRRLSAKGALMHPWFKSTEPLPTANVFSSLPNGNTIYPARRLIKDESDPKMVVTQPVAAVMPSALAAGQSAAPGNNVYGPGSLSATAGAVAGAGHQGGGGSAFNSVAASTTAHSGLSSHLGGLGSHGIGAAAQTGMPLGSTFLNAAGPPAPPPAHGSVGSAGASSAANSVGPTTVGVALPGAGGSSGHASAAHQGLGGGGGRGTSSNNNMVATATANAAGRQTKRSRMR